MTVTEPTAERTVETEQDPVAPTTVAVDEVLLEEVLLEEVLVEEISIDGMCGVY